MRSPNRISKRSDSAGTFAARVFEQYDAGLHRFLTRRLRGTQNVQDLAQEAYLRLLHLDRSDFVRKPQAYLYRIAANLVYEFKLRERSTPVAFDSEALEQAAEHPSESAAETSERLGAEQQLQSLLEQLPPLYQAVLVLRKRDGLSYAEIARALDISVHTVKKYLARAVAQCRSSGQQR